MNTGLLSLIIVFSLILLVVLRWAHRCWAKAFLSTLFAPLIGVPIAAVAFMAVTLLLRILNGFLSGFAADISTQTLGVVAGTMTSLFMLVIAVHYCREQRHLSLIETSPRFGPGYSAPKPDVYRMPGPKI
ncbi:MAG: hypothetical protein AAF733_04520 [Verrucomicrobiota bacterium]